MPVHNSFICLQRCCRTALEKLYPAGVPTTAMRRCHHKMQLPVGAAIPAYGTVPPTRAAGVPSRSMGRITLSA